VTSVAQSACLRDIKAIRAVKLLIEFVVVPPPADTIFDFRAVYCSENLSLKYEQLVLLPFGQHPRFTAVKQDWADQGLVNGESSLKHLFAVWILRCISRLMPFVGVIGDPSYTISLATSKCLSPMATLCPTSRIVLSVQAVIIYFVFCSFIFNPTLAASLSNVKYASRTAD
jgi:hypothetical protein